MTKRLQDISIYLGNKCNFDCEYCDRGYISTKIGDQQLHPEDIPKLLTFLDSQDAFNNPPEMFSFHGGEPFVYVKLMDKFLDAITEKLESSTRFFIQTNGSLITQHRWFFEKWGKWLHISISYDFMFQDLNRTMFQIGPAVELMRELGVQDIQLQYVMPINNPKVFSVGAIKAITDVCFKYGVRKLDLIPLRHLRGKDKFKVILDEVNLPQFADAFMKFIQVLYALGLDVIVDGHTTGFDKDYFGDHKQMILSPDGLIYPEYDFLEYQWHQTTIGKWKDGDIELTRTKDEEHLLLDHCKQCSSRDSCGLKYLFKGFDADPSNSQCAKFYQLLDVIIKHAQKLKQKPNFFHWIGV